MSFHTLIERLPDGISVLQGDQLVYVNPTLVTLLGCGSPEELLGLSSAELATAFIHPEDFASVPREVREALRAGKAVSSWEVRILRKSGGVVPAEISQVPGMFEGRPCLIRIVHDLTDRKQMEVQLLRADRMASLGTLAAGIAHEINNPLAYAIANLTHLESEVLPELGLPAGHREDVRKLLSDAQLGAGRVRDIVRQLKMFSRTEEDARPEPVDVHRVLETAISMASNGDPSPRAAGADYTEPLVVAANEGRLGQVFLNLLVNAAQAIPEGDVERNEIRIVTRPHAEGVADRGARHGRRACPPEHLEQLFEPFFTTKPVGVGTGLGLSICHDIVTGFGGRMEVESEVGQGEPPSGSSCPPPFPASLAAEAPPPALASRGVAAGADPGRGRRAADRHGHPPHAPARARGRGADERAGGPCAAHGR